MTIRKITGAGVSALLIAGAAVALHGVNPAIATSRIDARAQKEASRHAAKARKALDRHQWDKAVREAEAAVTLDTSDSGYRAILGNAYLRSGRFSSAEQAFSDVTTLRPNDGTVALNLALAQIAGGKWDAARSTLDAHAGQINAADRGLAIALAGDPAQGVEVLTTAARTPEANAKTRQNLALALALAGRWQEARAIVGMDMNPADADRRMVEWASFAKPQGAADQVASLLGVRPVVDPGQPVALALSTVEPAAALAAVDQFMPGRVDAPVETAATVETVATVESAPEPTAPPAPVVAYSAPARVARVATPLITARGAYKVSSTRFSAKPSPLLLAKPAVVRAPARGNWMVQLGAFENAAVAQEKWNRAVRTIPALRGLTPNGMSMAVSGATYYRLSVGGYARPDADSLCRKVRAARGTCFVRSMAGDQIAAWHQPAKRTVQVASR